MKLRRYSKDRNIECLAKKNFSLILFIVLSGVVASILEGVTLGFVLPILGSDSLNANSINSKLLSCFVDFFASMDLMQRIRWIAILLVGVTVVKGVCLYLNNLWSCLLQVRVVKFYRMKVFEQINSVGMGFINANKKGHIQSITVNSVNMIGYLVQLAGVFLPKVFMIIVLLAMLFMLSWKLTLTSIVIVAIASLFIKKLLKVMIVASEHFKEHTKDLNATILDVLMGLKVVRLFSRQKEITEKFELEVDKLNKLMFKVTEVQGAVRPLFEMLGVACLACIMLAASFLLGLDSAPNSMPILILFMVVFFRLLTPAMAFNQFRTAAARYLPHYFEVQRFINKDDKPYIISGDVKKDSFLEKIEFNNVTFSYNKGQDSVINNITLEIPKGAKIGVVGSSGCGKSTLIELLLRFYDVDNGQISVDGFDLAAIDTAAWRKLIGTVNQEVFLFHDTIKNNILFANPSATDEEVFEAAKRAYAHDFIEKMPEAYDTVVGDHGVLLSGGQRQRLAIARMIVANTDILIFDEATSALDTESEQYVQKALAEVGKDKTVITIAHRLSTIKDSDLIFVMDKGKIVERGTHDQLMNNDSLYKKLVTMQDLTGEEL